MAISYFGADIDGEYILNNVKEIGKYLKKKLFTLKEDWRQIGEVRGLGLHIGIELVKNRDTREADHAGCKAVRDAGLRNGIIFGLGGSGYGKNVIKIKPPFIITKLQADEILSKLQQSMSDVYNK